jgi:DNA-binding transcriptional MocR family regulator
MIAAIQRYLPPGIHFDTPQGGLFLWVRLPDKLSSEDLLPVARREGVDFVPGGRFFPDGLQGNDWMRLNFVLHSPDEIEEGIKRLGTAIEHLAGKN